MPSGRNRSSRPTESLVLFALVGLGALAALLSVREERQAVHLADERAADVAASQIRGALSSTLGSLRGADALAVDGSVGRAEFEAFATDVISQSLFQAVAFAEVVPETERAAFETRTGLTIRDTDGHGGFVPGVVRPRSLVVAMVLPLNDSNRPVLGFDIASDPIRLAAATASEQSGLPAMSDQIMTATLAKPGLAVLSAIRRPDGTTLGFLSSGLDLTVVLERAGVQASSFAGFSIRMDGTMLTGAPAHGATSTFEVAGHRFDVTADTGSDINLALPIVIGAGTLALLAAVMAAARRDRRQREQIALSARRSRAINALGQELAAATDVKTVLDEVLARGGDIMDAELVGVALTSIDDPALLTLRHDRRVQRTAGRTSNLVGVDEARPACECVRSATEVSVTGRAALLEQFPAAAADATAPGFESCIWVPLLFGRDFCIGALGFSWPAPMSSTSLEERRVAAHTVADLTSRSLERAITSMTVQAAADNLGELARGLAGSHEPLDVQSAVRTHAAAILGAATAELVVDPAADPAGDAALGQHTVAHAIEDRAGATIARLVLGWPRPILLGAAQAAVLDTVVEMLEQTLERTAMTEQEHQVIVQLQRDLLPRPPELSGIDLAVRYQPALSIVGLGGDFYDVIPGDHDRVFVVIGDVTGHGSEAVATMAELKAVIQSLLLGGRDLDEVCDEADRLLARRGTYATAQIVAIDPLRRTMQMVNAGHPFPVMRRLGGTVELLTGGHRALLGLCGDAPSAPSAIWHFEAGDTLLLYTDGVIERRHQSIDAGMQLLVDLLRDHGGEGTATDLVDLVLAASATASNGDKTDDDMAMLVVRLLA